MHIPYQTLDYSKILCVLHHSCSHLIAIKTGYTSGQVTDVSLSDRWKLDDIAVQDASGDLEGSLGGKQFAFTAGNADTPSSATIRLNVYKFNADKAYDDGEATEACFSTTPSGVLVGSVDDITPLTSTATATLGGIIDITYTTGSFGSQSSFGITLKNGIENDNQVFAWENGGPDTVNNGDDNAKVRMCFQVILVDTDVGDVIYKEMAATWTLSVDGDFGTSNEILADAVDPATGDPSQAYTATAYFCDDSFNEVTDGTIQQGDLVRCCIDPVGPGLIDMVDDLTLSGAYSGGSASTSIVSDGSVLNSPDSILGTVSCPANSGPGACGVKIFPTGKRYFSCVHMSKIFVSPVVPCCSGILSHAFRRSDRDTLLLWKRYHVTRYPPWASAPG